MNGDQLKRHRTMKMITSQEREEDFCLALAGLLTKHGAKMELKDQYLLGFPTIVCVITMKAHHTSRDE